MNTTIETELPPAHAGAGFVTPMTPLEKDIENGTISAAKWCELVLDVADPVFGEPENCIVRPLTKNIILAPEKSFKTTISLRVLLGLSCGRGVFPQLPVPKARRVLYIHGELSPPEIQERTRDGMNGLAGCDFYQACNHRVNLCSPDGQRCLEDILDRRNADNLAPDILVLDPWQEFIAGFDENNFKEISAATKFLERLIHKYKVTLFLVVHTGKDPAKGARGHSLLAGWRDTLIKLKPDKHHLAITVTVEPRWARPVPPFTLKFADGTVWPTDSVASKFGPQAEQIRGLVTASGGQIGRDDLAKQMGLSADALRKALARAQSSGAIQLAGAGVTLARD